MRTYIVVCLVGALCGCTQGHPIDGQGSELGVGSEGAAGSGADGEDGEARAALGALTYYADAKPIIDAKCATCHVEDGIGPMPLTTYEEVEAYTALIEVAVAEDVMPPWRASGPHDLYVGDRRLTREQKEILLAWIDQGADEGDPDDEAPALPTTQRELERVDMSLEITEPYTPVNEPDDYRCFPLEWPHDTTKYVTAVNVNPDNTNTVHHALVYLVQPSRADRVRDLDAEDPLPGYECFGTTGGAAAWLTSYEPGGYPQPVPGGLGFEVEPGSIMLLQIHYNTFNDNGPDQSAIDFNVEDEVERVGNVNLIMNPSWLAGFMSIPANEPKVVHSYTAAPLSQAYDIYWADLHMHTLGSAGRIGVVPADRPDQLEPLLEIPDWSFEWQETFIFREPVRVSAGDRLYVECHFDNTAENQYAVDGERLQPRDVNWGEGTTDEMCLGNVLLAPVN